MSLKSGWVLFKQTGKDWNSDNAQTLAAALAYYTAFSIAPLLVIAVAVAGLAFGDKAVRGDVAGQLQGLVGPGGAQAIQGLMASASKPSAGIIANVVGIAALLIGASGVFVQLRQSLNIIWKVETAKTSGVLSFIRSRLLSFGMVLTIGFLLMVSLLLSTGIAAVGSRLEQHFHGSEILLHLASSVLSFAIVTVLFALIYKLLPDARVEWRDVWLGAAVTSFLFTVGKLAIGIYLGKGSVSSSYGATASLGIVLLWVYYSSQILFFGAEFTHVFAQRRTLRPESKATKPKPILENGERSQWTWSHRPRTT